MYVDPKQMHLEPYLFRHLFHLWVVFTQNNVTLKKCDAEIYCDFLKCCDSGYTETDTRKLSIYALVKLCSPIYARKLNFMYSIPNT